MNTTNTLPHARILYIVISIYCLLALAAPLLGYIVTGSHMRLSGDDYCYDGILVQSGFLKMQWNSYTNITPYSGNRFALTLLASLLGSIGPKANALAPGLFLIIWILSAVWLIKHFQPQSQKRVTPETSLAAILIIFSTLSLSPSLEQSLYWRSAMLPYFAPIVANTILIGLILDRGGAQGSSSLRKITVFALAFLAGGFSETGVALQLGYLSLWMISALIQKQDKVNDKANPYPLIGIAFLGTALAILLLVTSPTNALRRTQLGLPEPPSLLSLIQMSINNAYLFLHSSVKWLFLPHLLILLYFFTLSLRHPIHQSSDSSTSLRSRIIMMILLPMMAFALLGCIVAPSAWAQSSYPVARAMVMGRLITVLASATGGWIVGRIIKQGFKHFHIHQSVLLVTTILLMITISAFPILESIDVWSELPKYERWSAAWDARDQRIREARASGMTEIEVMEIDHIIPDVTELKPDPDFWYNNCAEWYYDLQKIRANQSGWDD